MKRQATWWKLYLFAGVACLALFLFPPANHVIFILWVVMIYGGIAVWLKTNQTQVDEIVDYLPIGMTPSVAEFFDEDRVYLQQTGTEIPDDNLHSSPHEAA